MKIIIPILGFGRAGGYRVLSQFANEWVKKGHEVDFLCPDSSEAPYFPTKAGILWVDGSGEVSRSRDAIENPTGWYHISSLYRGLKTIGSNYQVIFANHSLTAWPVALAPCHQSKKIYYIQAYEPEYYTGNKTIKGYLLAVISALSYHLPLKRVVNSPIYFRYKNLRASEFVPPGLDLNNFKPEIAKKTVESKKNVVIGCIGRHEPEKGTLFVLRAFEKLHKKDSRFFLRIAYGNLPEAWEHEQSEIIEPKNDQELADFYRSLDILVAPGTLQHGAPHYPVLEAAACGVAVVTTGYLGATQETAWIVKNKSVDAIVKSIVDIIHNDDLRVEKAKKFMNEINCYSWEKVSTEMLKYF